MPLGGCEKDAFRSRCRAGKMPVPRVGAPVFALHRRRGYVLGFLWLRASGAADQAFRRMGMVPLIGCLAPPFLAIT